MVLESPSSNCLTLFHIHFKKQVRNYEIDINLVWEAHTFLKTQTSQRFWGRYVNTSPLCEDALPTEHLAYLSESIK